MYDNHTVHITQHDVLSDQHAVLIPHSGPVLNASAPGTRQVVWCDTPSWSRTSTPCTRDCTARIALSRANLY